MLPANESSSDMRNAMALLVKLLDSLSKMVEQEMLKFDAMLQYLVHMKN